MLNGQSSGLSQKQLEVSTVTVAASIAMVWKGPGSELNLCMPMSPEMGGPCSTNGVEEERL
jgi:hypothetical protein